MFEVEIEGGGRKVITVRSAVCIYNHLSLPLLVKVASKIAGLYYSYIKILILIIIIFIRHFFSIIKKESFDFNIIILNVIVLLNLFINNIII